VHIDARQVPSACAAALLDPTSVLPQVAPLGQTDEYVWLHVTSSAQAVYWLQQLVPRQETHPVSDASSEQRTAGTGWQTPLLVSASQIQGTPDAQSEATVQSSKHALSPRLVCETQVPVLPQPVELVQMAEHKPGMFLSFAFKSRQVSLAQLDEFEQMSPSCPEVVTPLPPLPLVLPEPPMPLALPDPPMPLALPDPPMPLVLPEPPMPLAPVPLPAAPLALPEPPMPLAPVPLAPVPLPALPLALPELLPLLSVPPSPAL
jgi:hypothetical protein